MKTLPLTLFTLLLMPVSAFACGYPSTPGEEFLMGSMYGVFMAIPALLLPIALVIKFRNNIQSWLWSTMIVLAAWPVGAMGVGLATMIFPASMNELEQFTGASGIMLVAMTATTMILYRMRSKTVIARRNL